MSTPLKRLSLMTPLLTLCIALAVIAPRTGAAQEGNASGSAPKAEGDTQADKDKADKDKTARKSDKKKDASKATDKAKAADKSKAADEAAPLTDDELDQQILEQLKSLGYTE